MKLDFKYLEEKDPATKLGYMRFIASQAAYNEDFRLQLRQAANNLGINDIYKKPIEFLARYLKDYVYTQDPFSELYQYPQKFHYLLFGDCDCVAIYIASVLTIMRIENIFVTPYKDNHLKHVYNRILLGDKIFDIDATRRDNNGNICIKLNPTVKTIPKGFNKHIMQLYLKGRKNAK